MIGLLLIRNKVYNLKNKEIISFMLLLLFSFIATNEIITISVLIVLAFAFVIKEILRLKIKQNILMYFCFLNFLTEIVYNFFINY